MIRAAHSALLLLCCRFGVCTSAVGLCVRDVLLFAELICGCTVLSFRCSSSCEFHSMLRRTVRWPTPVHRTLPRASASLLQLLPVPLVLLPLLLAPATASRSFARAASRPPPLPLRAARTAGGATISPESLPESTDQPYTTEDAMGQYSGRHSASSRTLFKLISSASPAVHCALRDKQALDERTHQCADVVLVCLCCLQPGSARV